MSLAYFHSVIRERRRYGPVAWNIIYDFNESDFRISMRQLYQMIQNYDEIPLTALKYLTKECYYGGKVTDDSDRKVLTAMIENFYHTDLIRSNEVKFNIFNDQLIIPPSETISNLEAAIKFIGGQDEISDPRIYGLNENAQITAMILEADF
jgi:dynein heavy chain, axonemal